MTDTNQPDPTKLEKKDLQAVFVVAQCLDNQWTPRSLLNAMIASRQKLADVVSERDRLVRAEYLRSLVNSRQTVINRAYLYNNSSVYRDYMVAGLNRDAFKSLVTGQVIVPFLFSEQTPQERPGFPVDPRGFSAWKQICQEVPVGCVRLSWKEPDNKRLIREQLSRRFHNFALSMNTGDVCEFLRDVDLPVTAEPAFKRRLSEIARACLDISDEDRLATRDDLYARFVVADGTPTDQGKYDPNKPFAAAVKQFLDLDYNVNLPDALGGFPLTPSDSLSRTALQEWRELADKPRISAGELLGFLRQAAFAIQQEGLFLRSFDKLELQDVVRLRETDEWTRYIEAMEVLVRDPLRFSDPEGGAQAVYEHYVELAARATDLAVARRAVRATARWMPIIELVVDVAGAVLKVIWSSKGPCYALAGEVSGSVAEKGAPLVARLVIRGISRLAENANLSTSIDFMERRVEHAADEWKEIIRRLGEMQGLQRVPADLTQPEESNINYAEAT